MFKKYLPGWIEIGVIKDDTCINYQDCCLLKCNIILSRLTMDKEFLIAVLEGMLSNIDLRKSQQKDYRVRVRICDDKSGDFFQIYRDDNVLLDRHFNFSPNLGKLKKISVNQEV